MYKGYLYNVLHFLFVCTHKVMHAITTYIYTTPQIIFMNIKVTDTEINMSHIHI